MNITKLIRASIISLSLLVGACASSMNNLPDKIEVAGKRKAIEKAYRDFETVVEDLEIERTRLIDSGLLSTVQISTSAEYIDKLNEIMSKVGPWIKTGEGESPTKKDIKELIDNASNLLDFVDSIHGSSISESTKKALDYFKTILG